MESLKELFELLRNPEQLVSLGGYTGLTLIVFIETGLLIGFLLPGDSLLVTAGLLAGSGAIGLNIVVLNLLLIPAAIIGDAVGYWIGRRAGRPLVDRPDSRFFKRTHLLRTQAFYERHGGKTIVLARFVPIIRMFAPVVAGVAAMPYRRFAMFNIVGGIGWVLSMTLLGYFLAAVSTHFKLRRVSPLGLRDRAFNTSKGVTISRALSLRAPNLHRLMPSSL